MWSNSSRCRQESVYLLQTWCLYTWSCLDNLIIIRFYINSSTVICSPTVILMLSWEKPLVKPMAPGSIFYHITFQSTFICIFTICIYIIKYQKYIYVIILYIFYLYRISFTILQSLLFNLYNKNTKNISLIISIRSHFCKWPWRDWQPLYRVGCKVLICLCRCEATCV